MRTVSTGAGAMTAAGMAVAAMTAGCGARSTLDQPDGGAVTETRTLGPSMCVQVDPGSPRVTVDMDTDARLTRADVVFVVDRTGSMAEEIDAIRTNLRQVIIPGIAQRIPDVRFGVVDYGDFPVAPYGDPGEEQFHVTSVVQPGIDPAEAAVSRLRAAQGGDDPEGLNEAMYQSVTGEGYLPFIPVAAPCATPGAVGAVCFRPDAQPILVVVTDAPSHNGPSTRRDYDPRSFIAAGAARGPHTYAETLAALGRAGARVVGINAGLDQYSGREDLMAYARLTHTVDLQGQTLVYDLGPDAAGLDARVVDGIDAVAQGVRMEVSARATVLDPVYQGLVEGVTPAAAVPAGGIEGMDGQTFHGVVPGTRLRFALALDPSQMLRMHPGPARQSVPVRVDFLLDGHAALGSRTVTVVVPGTNGDGCVPE